MPDNIKNIFRIFSKIIFVLFLLSLTAWIYFRNYRYLDLENKCNISIPFSFFSAMEFNNGNIIKALEIMKKSSPSDYKLVCSNIHIIDNNISCGGISGGCYQEKLGVIQLSTLKGNFIGWTSAVIIHETCHDIQKRQNRNYDENECAKMGSDLSKKIVMY